MAVADGAGLPLAVDVAAASAAEVTRVAAGLSRRCVGSLPERLIGDKGYDSDPLDARLAERGVERLAPNRENRRTKSQAGRPWRRYRRRWTIARLMAWLHNFRRIGSRWAVKVENYLGFVQLGGIHILLRQAMFLG